jgi:hypothetical protein
MGVGDMSSAAHMGHWSATMRSRLAAWLALTAGLFTLSAGSCESPTGVSETEVWRITMEESPTADRRGRMYFYLRLNRTNSSSPSCARITTFLATVEAIDMRLQPGGSGSSNGNWSDSGHCSWFEAELRMQSGEVYQLVGPPPDETRQIGFAVGNWFGPNGRWGGWRMDMLPRADYHPDSHVDIELFNLSGTAYDSVFVKTDSTVVPAAFRGTAPAPSSMRNIGVERYDSTATAYGPRRPVTYTIRVGARNTPSASDAIVRCRMDATIGGTVAVNVMPPGQPHACVGWPQIVNAVPVQ